VGLVKVSNIYIDVYFIMRMHSLMILSCNYMDIKLMRLNWLPPQLQLW